MSATERFYTKKIKHEKDSGEKRKHAWQRDTLRQRDHCLRIGKGKDEKRHAKSIEHERIAGVKDEASVCRAKCCVW